MIQWTKEPPKENGWYWIRYYSKKYGCVIQTAAAIHLWECRGEPTASVSSIGKDFTVADSIPPHDSLRFGPKIEEPDLC